MTNKMNKNIDTARFLCLLLGLFLIVSGILLLFFPILAQILYDIPNIDVLKEPIAHAMGIRQLSLGLITIVLVLTKQIKTLAYVTLIIAIVPLADFIIFTPLSGMLSSLRHFSSVPFIIGIGLYLLAQSKKMQHEN